MLSLAIRSGLLPALLLAALAAQAQTPEAPAEEPAAAEASFEASLLTHYVWRGQVLNDRPVAQNSFTLSSSQGFYAGVWANADLTDRNRSVEEDEDGNVTHVFNPDRKCSEFDSYAGYEYAPDDSLFGVDVNVTHYSFTEPDGDTDEAAAKAWLNLPLFGEAVTLSPFVSAVCDFSEADGFYYSAGAEAEAIALNNAESLLLDLSVSAGYGDSDYNAYYFEYDKAGWNDLTASTTLSYQLNDLLTLKGTVSYSILLDSHIADAARTLYWDDEALTAGLGAELTF
jgi:uncharacterized protein (TIGR02001 family)